MPNTIRIAGLNIAQSLYDFVEKELTPETGIDSDSFWKSLSHIICDLGPQNRKLLIKRDRLQAQIDEWHRQKKGSALDLKAYKTFLFEIGYLIPEGDDFEIIVSHVDLEIAKMAGPQLVVPVDNARYAINAANARWGSLYDAFYGTDIIPEYNGLEKGLEYNPNRGDKVFEKCAIFLDETFRLTEGSHSEVIQYRLVNARGKQDLVADLKNGRKARLIHPEKLVGYQKENNMLACILLQNNGLHVQLRIDRKHPIGRSHPAGLKDVILEASITTIQDCEDAVAAVDVDDKIVVYRNWLGLMKGTLETEFCKNGKRLKRKLNPDFKYFSPNGTPFTLPGRSLMLVRNVGAHMYTDAVTTAKGEEIPEAFLDAMITALAAVHDIKDNGPFKNSRKGNIYIVKPKLHGPEEVAATVELFVRVEKALKLKPETIKLGIMDEERRTSVNLKESIRQAKNRIIFINTGFLDRTGDEIHTSMEAGPMITKSEMKNSPWMLAYENSNVDIGLRAGFSGRAQIGKGMWAMPDAMSEMVRVKIAHPLSGANTAWVPSPTAATLHALHYHKVNVAEEQTMIAGRKRAKLDDLLQPPLVNSVTLNKEMIEKELKNNAQSILGYVVRWIDQGIGCSKVQDINNIGLMEDRATLRISSQHIVNWLRHGLITKKQVLEILKKMALIVDQQNAEDPVYKKMSPDFENNIAFQAALELVFKGCERPNGYTEWTLHPKRRKVKKMKVSGNAKALL